MTDTKTPINIPKVFIFGPGHVDYIKMFLKEGYEGTNSLVDADLVCFTGGADVDPTMYGEQPLKTTMFDRRRDNEDMEVYLSCIERGIPMVGICRGGQFLNVMNGGKMWQHVNNHCAPHPIVDCITKKVIPRVSSTHHQMMRPGDAAIHIAYAEGVATTKLADGLEEHKKDKDWEVLYYEDSMSLCFQPHPEMNGYAACTEYFFHCLMANIGEDYGWFDDIIEPIEEDDESDMSLESLVDRMNQTAREIDEGGGGSTFQGKHTIGRTYDSATGRWVHLDDDGNVIEEEDVFDDLPDHLSPEYYE